MHRKAPRARCHYLACAQKIAGTPSGKLIIRTPPHAAQPTRKATHFDGSEGGDLRRGIRGKGPESRNLRRGIREEGSEEGDLKRGI